MAKENKKNEKKVLNQETEKKGKSLRARREEKRLERFGKRREEGRAYTYKKGHAAEVLEKSMKETGSVPENYNPFLGIWLSNVNSGRAMHTEVSRWRSAWKKLENEVAKDEEERRMRQAKKENKR